MLPLRKMMMRQVPAFTTEDFEYRILEILKGKPDELVVNKSTRCAFIDTCPDHKMRMMGINTLEGVGAVIEGCVAVLRAELPTWAKK